MNTLRKIPTGSSPKGLMPLHYHGAVKILSLFGFAWAIIAFLNEAVFHFVETDAGPGRVFLSHWTEYFIIACFGIWRTIADPHRGTRVRFAILTVSVPVFWWIFPAYLAIPEPSFGLQNTVPKFVSLHTPGTLTFFISIVAVFFFGRRTICGYFCPCVAIREVVGFPFRNMTPRSREAFRWRHLKWPFLALYAAITVTAILRMETVYILYTMFHMVIVLPYFATFLLSPWLGNRSYCRFICPYGALFGLLNKFGAFSVHADSSRCSGCGICDKVCDMGIPISENAAANRTFTGTGECMGCGRCVAACPQDVLELRDIRHWAGKRTR